MNEITRSRRLSPPRGVERDFQFETVSNWDNAKSIAIIVFGIFAMIWIVFLTAVIAAYIAFGDTGLRSVLWGGAVLLVLTLIVVAIWAFVSLGSKIALQATKTASTVFMRADVVDAYTDKIRMDAARGAPETVTMLPPAQQQLAGYLELQLPAPKDQLVF